MNELINNCTFVGRLGKDPELQYTPNGHAMTRIGLGVRMRSFNSKENKSEYSTTWVDFTAFGKIAETIQKICKKGDKLIISAEYSKSTSEKNGDKRTYHNFTVRNFELLGNSNNDSAKSNGRGYSNQNEEDEEDAGDADITEEESEDEFPF